ncbi:MAG: BREX system Lon protease-like protein BrxL [Verrucomicrobiota bacterium]
MNALNDKINAIFPGRVVRKDLVQRVKKGTNAPTFVLEFLLARYCATDDPDEIEAGLAAVNETLQGNFVRPNESNAAQSLVQQKGSHKFIDKVRVTHNEKERRHWAEMENFGSRRIAINDNHYRGNPRLLEGGLWCEVVVGYNYEPGEGDDDYTFHIEELRPIQVSRFDFDSFVGERSQFSTDEWRSLILRSIGMEADNLTPRQQMHYLARLLPLVEGNYNFIELGPRGTGKSYTFSEFSPYSTLISGGQTTTATLFYNKTRRQVGIIGYWDNIAFDEVAGIKVKDPGTIQILKDYMANGRFSLGTEVIAPASLAFIGNIDDSIAEIVRSAKHDLFKPLPPEFDLAVIHRFHLYLAGWEIPSNADNLLTVQYGFITDYMAEAFHHLFKHRNYFSAVKKRARLGPGYQGRDEAAVYKTVAGFIKLLHPDGECSDDEFEHYLTYAIEGRRRVKEQLNKRKADDEFAEIHLSYVNTKGETVEVHCPESIGIEATLSPRRHQNAPETPAITAAATIAAHIVAVAAPPVPKPTAATSADSTGATAAAAAIAPTATAAQPVLQPALTAAAGSIMDAATEPTTAAVVPPASPSALKDKQLTIRYGDTGCSYRSLFGDYLVGAKKLVIEDPYIRRDNQIRNLLQLCELAVEAGTIKDISLVTTAENAAQQAEAETKLEEIKDTLADCDVAFTYRFSEKIPEREIRTDTGWHIQIDRGLEIYQGPLNSLKIGATNYDLRPCMETKVKIFNAQ